MLVHRTQLICGGWPQMTYVVKEIYYTLQGRGAHTGRQQSFVDSLDAIFGAAAKKTASRLPAPLRYRLRRTDGPGGGRFLTAELLAETIERHWKNQTVNDVSVPYVVFTGGEPALQLDERLVAECQSRGFEVAIETNGTRPLPAKIDWVCVSPKPGPPLVITSGDELKLVYPQSEVQPETVQNLDFSYFYLQPLDNPQREEHTAQCIEYCRHHPKWRLSLQTHKLVGIP